MWQIFSLQKVFRYLQYKGSRQNGTRRTAFKDSVLTPFCVLHSACSTYIIAVLIPFLLSERLKEADSFLFPDNQYSD